MSVTNHAPLINIIKAFPSFGKYVGFRPIVDGHINDTYVVEYKLSDGKSVHYLLQRINTHIFTKPDELMENVVNVTDYLRERIAARGGDVSRETVSVCKTKDGQNYYKDSRGDCWRMYTFVYGTYSLNVISSPEIFKNAAIAFGDFQKDLADFPVEKLYETIPDFHNTVSRFRDFVDAVCKNIAGRKELCQEEIDFIFERGKDCMTLVNLIDKGEIPLRVTHNDTKLNNILFDDVTNKGICVVDLDTVMPGLSLYDFGDSIRFGASTGAEDEPNLDKVSFSLELFKAYVEGYLESAGKALTENEIKYLPFSAKLLTLECGMRFLGDFLNGDTYFKVDYPEHNLVRARTQLKLVKEMEEKMEQMEKIVEEERMILGI